MERHMTIPCLVQCSKPAAVTEIDFYAHLEECLIAHGPIIATAICCCFYTCVPPSLSVWELEFSARRFKNVNAIDGWT